MTSSRAGTFQSGRWNGGSTHHEQDRNAAAALDGQPIRASWRVQGEQRAPWQSGRLVVQGSP